MNINGLSAQEVLSRKEQGLVNATQDKITKTNSQIIHDNLFTPFNGFNFAIGVCLALVGAWVQMVYLLVIIANTLIAIVQELHAKKMVEHLSLISAVKATTVRDGVEHEVHVDELVLDDVTILKMGDQICADSEVLQGEVEVNESLLTGESNLVTKQAGDSLLSGSFVVSGKCYAKIEHVGADNFAAQIMQKAKQHKKINSELFTAISKITKFTGYFVIPLGIILFLESYLMLSQDIGNAVVTSAAALLGILPKGLVLLITFALVLSLIELSKKRILVQGLHSIETLAHVDLLCLDKTGTITEGKMSVREVHVIDESAIPVSVDNAIKFYIGAADDSNTTFQAMKEHFGTDNSMDVVHKIPFSSERKWGAVTFKHIGTLFLGAPEKILSGGSELPDVVKNAQKLGNRILFLGFSQDSIDESSLSSVTPVAAIEFSDPIRKNAKETLDFFRREGMDIKIISGDNPITVSNIAKQAGLENYENYIDLSQIDAQIDSDEAITALAKKYSVFGRVTPHQKKQLIKAFKEQGHTVAMTGDGVNDVLALKEADCSIAMAEGSDAARQVSQLVLLDSDFSALPEVVKQGRRVINNATRFGSIFLIKTIFSFLISIVGALTLTPYPFLPIQVTLYDGAIEGYFAFMLSFERNTQRIDGSFLTNVFKNALPYALVIATNIFVISAIYPALGLSDSASTTAMYYTTASIAILAAIKACKPFNKYRLFVWSTMAIGFYLAAYLFTGLLELERLTRVTSTVFLSAVVLSVPLIMLFGFIISKFRKRSCNDS